MFLWHKFAPSATAMLIALTGCQTPGTVISAEQAFKSFPSECTARASIPAGSIVIEREDLKEAVARAGVEGPSYAGIDAVNHDTGYFVMCACGKNWDMSKMTEMEAQGGVIPIMKAGQWEQTEGIFDGGSDPIQYQFAGKRSSFAGELVIKGSMLFKGSCVTTFSVTDKASNVAAADRFLASIHDVRDAPQQTMPDAAGRLRTLQGLRDQRLITQEEYETQRTEILRRL
jgi:hypothetical protein